MYHRRALEDLALDHGRHGRAVVAETDHRHRDRLRSARARSSASTSASLAAAGTSSGSLLRIDGGTTAATRSSTRRGRRRRASGGRRPGRPHAPVGGPLGRGCVTAAAGTAWPAGASSRAPMRSSGAVRVTRPGCTGRLGTSPSVEHRRRGRSAPELPRPQVLAPERFRAVCPFGARHRHLSGGGTGLSRARSDGVAESSSGSCGGPGRRPWGPSGARPPRPPFGPSGDDHALRFGSVGG